MPKITNPFTLFAVNTFLYTSLIRLILTLQGSVTLSKMSHTAFIYRLIGFSSSRK